MTIPNNIKEAMERLKIDLYKIQCRNWVLSKGKGTSAAGKTLEILLGKDEDSNVLPDYHGIEIKTKSPFSPYPITLFSCAFDTKPHEMYRLLEVGGYPDKKDPNYKVFYTDVRANEWKRVRNNIYKIVVNYEKRHIELHIADQLTLEPITQMAWTFDELKSRLEHKLSYLAFVPVIRDRADGNVFFKYRNPKFYVLRGFDEFLKLVEDGSISVTFKIGFNRTPEKYGEYVDRGTSFNLGVDDIEKLFIPLEV